MKKIKCVIAGAGFKGFCDALVLSRIPGVEVTIIESAPFFGGIMNSFEIGGFMVDKGVHVFDSIPRDFADVVTEIMEGQVVEISFTTWSGFNGKITETFSLPNLDSLNDSSIKQKIKDELMWLADNHQNIPKPKSLHEHFAGRYGKTAGQIFSDIFENVYGIEASAVEPEAIAQTSMGRLKFLNDEEMMNLKRSNEWLDSVLAARRTSLGKVDDLVSIYPADGRAMKGWCERAHKWLEKRGVNVKLGEKIHQISSGSEGGVTIGTDKSTYHADYLIWSNDNVMALARSLGMDADYLDNYQYKTPMLFVTMVTHADKISDFVYLQNFDTNAVAYRTATAGRYSQQYRNGLTFLTSECAVDVNSEDWENPDKFALKVWNEIKALGAVSKDAELVESNVLKIPVSFKIPKKEYFNRMADLTHTIEKMNKNIILTGLELFFRRDIYRASLKLPEIINARSSV